jgi:putative transcriptional regulator
MFNGKMLKALRAAKGWTQQELATRAKVQRRDLSFYENGKQLPNLAAAYRLAIALGVTLDSFFSDSVLLETQAK